MGVDPSDWTYRNLVIAAEARLAFDFDRASAVIAALSSKPVAPASLNPYRRMQRKKVELSAWQLESQHRALAAGGKLIENVIPMDRVISNG